jgi:hypothetical protein
MENLAARIIATTLAAAAAAGLGVMAYGAVKTSNQAAATATRFIATMPIPTASTPTK